MHVNAFEIARDVLGRYVPRVLGGVGRCLEIGSLDVNGSYREHIEALGLKYTGCDAIEGRNVDVVGLHNVPDRGAWDLVFSASQLEHDRYPWGTIAFVDMLLRPGGLFVCIAPFVFPVHHEPDFWRFTPDGLATICKRNGLDVIEAEVRKCPKDAGVADSYVVARRPSRS